MNTLYIVAPMTAQADAEVATRLQEVGVDPASVSAIRYGSIPKGLVTEWVGVEPPIGPDSLLVNLVAPDADGREPSLAWGYSSHGTWSWSPEGAASCFNHTDLVAMRVESPTS